MSVEFQISRMRLQPDASAIHNQEHFLSDEPSSTEPFMVTGKKTMNVVQRRVRGSQTPMKSIKESVKVWRPWQLEQVELCQGVAVSTPARQFLAQEYMIVSVQSGAMDFWYRNARTRGQAVDGTLYVIEPGEVWSCQSEELSFSHILIDPTLLQQTATELFQREQPLPHFPRHALFDPSLSTILLHLAASSLAPVSRLQQDETLLHLLAQFLLSHAEKGGHFLE